MDGEGDTTEVGWEIRHDEDSGQVYYWNAVTGETSWEPPPHLAVGEEMPSAESISHPWTQAYDDNGRVYYLNSETMETRWNPPDSGEQQEEGLATSESDVLAVTGGRGRRPSTAEQMDELNRLLSGEGDEEDEQPLEGVDGILHQHGSSEKPTNLVLDAFSPPTESAVTDNDACAWMMFINEDDGVPYYYNHITGQCLWDPPEEFLRFHQDQQLEQEQQEQGLGDETGATTEVDAPASNASPDDTFNAQVDADAGPISMIQAAITPEFEEKVRQAIAAVSSTPVGSSRLVLVRTLTQQQLAPRTGCSAGGGSARSIPNSSRPRSAASRPSSGGAISRPRAAAQSRPTVETYISVEDELTPNTGEGELQGEVAAPIVGELPVTNELSDEDLFRSDSPLENVEDTQVGESDDNDEGANIGLIPELDSEEDENEGVNGTCEEMKIDSVPEEKSQGDTQMDELDMTAEIGSVPEKTQGDAQVDELDMTAEVGVIGGDMAVQINGRTEGETTVESGMDVSLVNDAGNQLEELTDNTADFAALTVVASGSNERSDIAEVAEEKVVSVAEELPDKSFPKKCCVDLAALTLQCMARCFIARQRVNHKREERDNAVDSKVMDNTFESDLSAVSNGLEGEQGNNSHFLRSFPTQPEENDVETLTDIASSQRSLTADMDMIPVSPASFDLQPQLGSARGNARGVEKSAALAPSVDVASVPDTESPPSSTPTQAQHPLRDRKSISTRLPPTLNVTTFFPIRRSLASSRITHTERSSAHTEPVAITRKKVEVGSPPRARRASQQELLEQQHTFEARRKEEERAERAQVLEYQRIFAESRKAFKTEKQRLLEDKLTRDTQREHDAEIEKRIKIQVQHERDNARARKKAGRGDEDRLVWSHLKTQGRPTEQSLSLFRDALTQALDSAQFSNNMCAERGRELCERIERLQRASWEVDSQLEAVELRLLSELRPLTDRQRPLQAKYAAKLRCRLEKMLDTVKSWQRVLDEFESGKQEGSTSRYWSALQARYDATSIVYSSDESRRLCILNEWRGAAGGDSLLHMAAWNGWEEHVRLLVDEGANVNLVDSSASHRTPLHEACRGGHAAVVELLLRSGARLSAVDVSGDSALHIACRGGWTRVVRVLLMAANNLGAEDELSKEGSLCLTLEAFFNLQNGKRRRAIEVVTLPSLVEELENFAYELNGDVK